MGTADEVTGFATCFAAGATGGGNQVVKLTN